MPKPGMTKERAALETTRSRLEAALSADSNWQALQRSRTQASADAGAPAAHDARLELLLLSNPLFRAWKEVDDALEDLRRTEAGGEPSAAPARLIPIPALAGSTAAKQIASLADLSQGIARLIERSVPSGSRVPARPRLEVPADVPAEPPPAVVETPQAVETPRLPDPAPVQATDELGPEFPAAATTAAAWQPPAWPIDPPAEPAAPPPPQAEPAPAAPVLTTEPAESRSFVPTPLRPRRELAPAPPEADETPFRHGLEPEEASVTFVAREPVAPRSRPERTHAPFGWSPARVPEKAETEDRFNIAHAPNDIEEAEVTILTADDLKQRQETAQRDGNLRRFRKALLGD